MSALVVLRNLARFYSTSQKKFRKGTFYTILRICDIHGGLGILRARASVRSLRITLNTTISRRSRLRTNSLFLDVRYWSRDRFIGRLSSRNDERNMMARRTHLVSTVGLVYGHFHMV